MAKHYVYSTLTCNQAYTNHAVGGADLPIALDPVIIRGGAGIANAHLVTPEGTVTSVTDEQLEYLRCNPCFLHHEKHGYIKVSTAKVDIEKVVADMSQRDQSAPVVPPDLKDEELPVESDEVDSPKKRRK